MARNGHCAAFYIVNPNQKSKNSLVHLLASTRLDAHFLSVAGSRHVGQHCIGRAKCLWNDLCSELKWQQQRCHEKKPCSMEAMKIRSKIAEPSQCLWAMSLTWWQERNGFYRWRIVTKLRQRWRLNWCNTLAIYCYLCRNCWLPCPVNK